MPRLAALGAALYRGAVYLYPPAFRREFGAEMLRDFAEASREISTSDDALALVCFWHQMTLDLLLTASHQWWRTGLPALAVISTFPAIAVMATASRLLRAPVSRLNHADAESLLLLLLAIVVLLIIVATTVFTLWFATPERSRQRS